MRWLRPEFQDPARRVSAAVPTPTQDELEMLEQPATAPPAKGGKPAAAGARSPWPNSLPEQMRAVAGLLTRVGRPIALEAIEAEFSGRGPWKRRIPQILDALAALGRARQVNGAWAAG